MTIRPAHWRGAPSTTFSTRSAGLVGIDGKTISATGGGSTRAGAEEGAELEEKRARRSSQPVIGAIQCLLDRGRSAALALDDMAETKEEAANPM